MTPTPSQLPQPDRRFHVADLNALGELLLEADYRYEALETIPFAWEVIVRCSTHLWRTPEEFELNLPSGDHTDVQLRWRECARGAGVLTLRYAGKVASLSLLAAGLDPEGDVSTRDAFQRHLLRELHDTGSEPAFGLLELPQRPLLATILILPPVTESARLSAAIIDRCFAASYFRYQGLV